jgi:hypothetical protein
VSKIDLYNGIKSDLQTIKWTDSTGATRKIKEIALWRNQLERENIETPFNYPAVFIEFLASNYMEGSSKVYQTLNMTCRLHICFETLKTEDTDILILTQEVFKTMQLKQYGYFGVMKRRSEEQNFDHNNVQDFIQDYDCGQAKDFYADQRPATDATITDIQITPQITHNL